MIREPSRAGGSRGVVGRALQPFSFSDGCGGAARF
eukprot:COSAG02_NODE_39228_length_419_cov_1.275000_1_plen_34_part_10